MSTERKGLEMYVGLFLFIGLATIAVMVIVFGRVNEGFAKTYPILVEFPNASGLVKGADVLLSGARIGKVITTPKLIGKLYAVEVTLKIREEVKVPRTAQFVVGSSGLLGDRYVDVIPPAKFDPKDMVEPGGKIVGTRVAGLDDLTQKGGEVMDQLKKELEDIQKITVQLHSGLLSEQNMQNLTETFAHLKTTSVNLSESMKKLDPIMTKADAAVDSAKGTMKTAEDAAGEFKKTVEEFRKVAGSASKTMDSAKGLVDSGKSLLDKANNGQGALGLLLSDRQTADNLRALITNMRRSGPVFYKDREPQVPAPTPAPRSRR
jgi:ABC-type transporter Mla subunit MlaD